MYENSENVAFFVNKSTLHLMLAGFFIGAFVTALSISLITGKKESTKNNYILLPRYWASVFLGALTAILLFLAGKFYRQEAKYAALTFIVLFLASLIMTLGSSMGWLFDMEGFEAVSIAPSQPTTKPSVKPTTTTTPAPKGTPWWVFLIVAVLVAGFVVFIKIKFDRGYSRMKLTNQLRSSPM